MSFLIQNPRLQPLDDDGRPMPDCYMQFYLTETTTPTPVYADGDLETPLDNPVESDSAGRFPAMYGDSSIVYRVQLYNADDELQWDTDPVHPMSPIPPRTVVWFYGDATERDAAYPPALFQVLDGTNGTPDGRDRVPMIAGGSYAAGDTGGAASVNSGAAGAHDHGGAVSEVVLDETNMPEHGHRLYVRTSATQRGNTRGFGFAGTAGLEGQIVDDAPYGYLEDSPSDAVPLVEPTGTADPTGHAHDVTEEPDHQHTVATLPPFVALWALMRRTA